MHVVVPALLPHSKQGLEEGLTLVSAFPDVSRVQIDIVDGGIELVPLPSRDRITYELDLMCLNPESVADTWIALGVSRVVFHAENPDIQAILSRTSERYGDKVSLGLAFSIDTDLSLVEEVKDVIQYVQLMGIAEIGKQGEPFDDRVIERVRVVRERYPDLLIQVDGGVTLDVAQTLLDQGVSDLVVGSAILRAPDSQQAFLSFTKLAAT